MIDLATLVLVTTVVGACELVVLLALSRIVRVYRGPLLWAAGVALIIAGNLCSVLRANAELEQVAAVLATAAFAGGLVANELGFRRFLDLPERRGLLGAALVLVVGATVVGEVAGLGPLPFQVVATLTFLALSGRLALLLVGPATLPFRTSARFLAGGFAALAVFMGVRLLVVFSGASLIVDPANPSPMVKVTQVVILACTIVLTFGFVMMAHQRLAEDLRAKERLLDEANATLEQRVVERTAQLEAANREMAAFTYSMSHDLRAPLRGINGFATLLSRRNAAQLDEQGQGYLTRIVATTEQMGVLIEELLDYARLGQAPVGREVVPLGPLVGGIRDTFEGRLVTSGASIDLADPFPAVTGDPQLITRIVTNLVDNALTDVAPGRASHVRIAAEQRGDTVTLSVADDGIGIPAEQQERIFEVFTRLQTQDAYPGSGIGLSIVRKAARLMDGEISISSVVGEGSIFRLALPAG